MTLTSNFLIGNTLFNGILRVSLSECVDVDFIIGYNSLSNVEFSQFLSVYLHAPLKFRDKHVSVRTLHLVDAWRRPENKLLAILDQGLEGRLLDHHGRWGRGCSWGTTLACSCRLGWGKGSLRGVDKQRLNLLI
jgi:hypothetical protein